MSMEYLRLGASPMEDMMPRAAITPAMPPPEGEVSNFENPPEAAMNLHAKTDTVGYVCTAIALIVIILRIWTRSVIVKKGLGADDYCIILCMACSITFLAVSIKDNTYGTGLHLWNVPFETFSPHFLIWEIAASAIYAPSVTLAKVSILLFYLRLSPERKFRITVFILIFVVVSYSLCSILTLIMGCLPVRAIWDLTITDATCINRNAVITILSTLNICTDIIILILPIRFVMKLQMPKRQKASLICVFLTGFFVCVCAIVRTALLKNLFENPDYTWEVVDQYIWSYLEINVGIVCASFPALKPFFSKYLPMIIPGSTFDRSKPSYANSRQKKGSYQLSSLEHHSRNNDLESGPYSYGGTNKTTVVGRVSDDASSTEAIRNKGDAMGMNPFVGDHIVRKTEVSVFESERTQRTR